MKHDPTYYRFGNQGPRHAANWRGDQGGVMPSKRAATSFALGSLSGTCFSGGSSISGNSIAGSSLAGDTLGNHMLESHAPGRKQYPSLFRAVKLGDWPSQRAAGQEPLDPSGLGGTGSGAISLVAVAALVGIAFLMAPKKK